MTWFKVDDGFWSHPKTMALSPGAVALWVRAGAYSCQHLTDGVILSRVTPLLDPSEGREQHAQELVDAGLWTRRRDGYQFHDWEDYQETSQDVKKRRDQWKQRQRRARESREESRVTPTVTHAPVTRESLSPVPSRPDPLSSTKKEGGNRARPLPPDWQPNDAHRALAAQRGVDCDLEASKMRDWASDKGATGKDWDARFRNWLHRATPDRDHNRSKTSTRLDGSLALIHRLEAQERHQQWNAPRQLDS